MSNIKKWNIEQIFADRFAKYSKSIILDRALPDVRDGLKPVQRRIVYSMYLEKNIWENQFRKSAKTVGNVISYFHPHGDTSIYDAMIRMSQEWKLRENLIEIHGNNGSMDGDSAAAMRYTEAKMTRVSNFLVNDIDKETVDFVPNFDDTSYEPCVLPGIFPNFLVNGGSGIAAGYATDIPPHNPKEVIETIITRMKNPSSSLKTLLKNFQGPDFPTGGIIHFDTPIEEIYTTGRGKITIYAKITQDKKDLIINEIPYEVNKAEMVKTIDQIRLSGKLPQLKLVRDETDRNGIAIRLRLDDAKNADLVKKFLYKKTNLSKSYNFNMVGIVNNKPRLLGLELIIDTFITHQQEVFTNKYNFLLKKYKTRLNIVAGLIKAVSILDEIIALIRASKDKTQAKNNLISRFEFNDEQAEAIVMMRLYRLSNTDITSLQVENAQLNEKITDLNQKLNDVSLLNNDIINSLKELLKLKELSLSRRSQLLSEKIDTNIEENNLIIDEEVILTFSLNSYIKRSSIKSYTASKDLTLNDDKLLKICKVSTKDNLVMFTNFGRYYTLSIHKIDEMAFKKRGNHVSSLFELSEGEKVIKYLIVDNFSNCKQKLIVSTNNGFIKQLEISELDTKRAKSYIKLKNNGEVNSIFIASEYVTCAATSSNSFTFNTMQIPLSKGTSSGVKIMSINENEETFVTPTKDNLLFVFENNHYKRLSHDSLNISNRGTKGKLIVKKYKTANLKLTNLFSFDTQVELFSSDVVSFEKSTIFKICDVSVKPKDFGREFKVINNLVEVIETKQENLNKSKIEQKKIATQLKKSQNETEDDNLKDIANLLDNILGE